LAGFPGFRAAKLRLALRLLLVRLYGEPLHVIGMIGSVAFQGDDVIDLIAWTRQSGLPGGRAGMEPDKTQSRRVAAGGCG
jgi:hypothetical protein